MSRAEQELRQIVFKLRDDQQELKARVEGLEFERDMLRQGIRKLKHENLRVKEKIKNLQQGLRKVGGEPIDDDDDEIWNRDYDDLEKNKFLLVGGVRDPLSPSYQTMITHEGLQHKSADRYCLYKMAEFFGDAEAMKGILEAKEGFEADEIAKNIKGFDEKKWNEKKQEVWEEAARLKFAQNRHVSNLLVISGDSYIAFAHHDKNLGTGWRKNRDEANKTVFWDGENLGGKFLMKFRKDLAKDYQWAGNQEKEEAKRAFEDLKRNVWRRVDPKAKEHFINNGYNGGYNYQGRGPHPNYPPRNSGPYEGGHHNLPKSAFSKAPGGNRGPRGNS